MTFKKAVKEEGFVQFQKDNPRAVEMLEEMQRIPWRRDIVNSLMEQAKKKGKLSPKQLSLVTDLYLDNCMTSDADIARQVACRKLVFRLMKCRLGRMVEFVHSVHDFTYNRPFTAAQMRAIQNIAKKKENELGEIKEYDETNFDGWNTLSPSRMASQLVAHVEASVGQTW